MFLVSYKETPTSGVITRKILGYKKTSVDNMQSNLRYETDISKTQLTIVAFRPITA